MTVVLEVSRSYNLPRDEWQFGWFISSVHAAQHIFYRFVPPLIPILVVDLNSPLWQLGLLVSIYMFSGGVFQAPMGEIADRVDRRYVLSGSIVAMSIGYLIFVVGPMLGSLIPATTVVGARFTGTFLIMCLGMFVAGIGYSGIHPVGYPLISANVSAQHKGKVLGMWGSASKIGDAVAPLLVAVLVLLIGWEWIVFGVALSGLAYAAAILVVIRRKGYQTVPLASDSSTDSGESLVLRDDPQQFLFPILVMLLFFLSLLFAGNGLVTFAPLFISDVYGYSVNLGPYEFGPESVANLYFSVLLLSAAASQLVTGAIADQYDYRAVIVVCLFSSTVLLVLLAVVTLSPIALLATFALLGATIYGINPVRDALISDISPDAYEGRTFGYIYTVALIGSSAFPMLIGYLADIAGIQTSFGVLAAGTILGIFCIVLLYSPRVYRV